MKRNDATPVPSVTRQDLDSASQASRAYIGLRQLLLRGEFDRGERLSEIPLAERLGMSRTPIRLALERLAHMQLLEVVPSGGFAVREFSVDDVRDAIQLRGVLEGTAARLAAERLRHDGELDGLRRACDEMEEHAALSMNTFSNYMDQNEAFHAAIVDLAKSEMLRRSLAHANSLPFASPSAMVVPTSKLSESDETMALVKVQHRSILNAIAKREGTRAEHLAREHALVGWHVFELSLDDDELLRRVPGGPLINTDAD
jgi:GntR family transcriptional regulator, vanillate catabolism transcriptional regulator